MLRQACVVANHVVRDPCAAGETNPDSHGTKILLAAPFNQVVGDVVARCCVLLTELSPFAKHQAIASKLVKEIARLDGDVSNFVTPQVHERLLNKLNK